jgi:excisionase family DNA binding protein
MAVEPQMSQKNREMTRWVVYKSATLRMPSNKAEPTTLVEPLLTKAQTAKLLGVCSRTVDNMVASGRLKLVKLGTAARIDPRDLRAFIDAAKQTGTNPD